MEKDIVQVILEKELTVKNPILIEGFPGIGLVGNIASQYIVNDLYRSDELQILPATGSPFGRSSEHAGPHL